MKLVSVLIQKSPTERHSAWVNPTYILALLPDRTAPTQRSVIVLAQPLADYGAQFVVAETVTKMRNAVNAALGGALE